MIVLLAVSQKGGSLRHHAPGNTATHTATRVTLREDWQQRNKLLRYSTDMLSIDLILMDREFDGEIVKDACDHNTVYYFSSKRMFDKQEEMAKQLRREGTLVHGGGG